jgi:hypothetical protein
MIRPSGLVGFRINTERIKCPDNVVGITTGYGLDDRGIGDLVPLDAKIFSYPCRPEQF